MHTPAKHRKTPTQAHKQLNIFQCKAWNPSPKTHPLNIITTDDTPGPNHTNKNPPTHNPPPVDTTKPPHLQENIKHTNININSTTPPLNNTNFTHPRIKVLTLNTRGMHTTIVDLQNILTTHPDPHIIALTETKHRNIKSIWRQTLKN
jgi:hypothetical protein